MFAEEENMETYWIFKRNRWSFCFEHVKHETISNPKYTFIIVSLLPFLPLPAHFHPVLSHLIVASLLIHLLPLVPVRVQLIPFLIYNKMTELYVIYSAIVCIFDYCIFDDYLRNIGVTNAKKVVLWQLFLPGILSYVCSCRI